MTTALRVTISADVLPGTEADPDDVLVVNACGVSGGDQMVELSPGQRREFWMGSQGRISVFPKPPGN